MIFTCGATKCTMPAVMVLTCSLIPHEIDYDFVERKGNKHVSEQAQRGGDDRGLETGRRRASRRGCGAGSGRVKAHDLRVEGEVRGDGCEPGAGSEAVA